MSRLRLSLAALLLAGTAASAQQTDLTIALQLEPPPRRGPSIPCFTATCSRG